MAGCASERTWLSSVGPTATKWHRCGSMWSSTDTAIRACPSGAIWGEIVFEPVRSLCSEQQMLSAGFVLSRKRVTVLWSYRSVRPCEDADITLQMSPFCRVPISQNAVQDMFAQSACKHLYRGCCEPYTRNRADHIATKDRSRSRNLGQHMNLIMSKNRASNEYVPLSPHAL